MPNSSGMTSSRRAVFGMSPAARYRELRVNRAVYLLGLLLLCAPWAAWWNTLWNEMHVPASDFAAAFPNPTTLHAAMASILQQFTQGALGLFVPFFLFAALALGLALFVNDRVVGGLLYSLEGPIRRGEVYAAKVLFGTTAVLLPALAGTTGIALFAVVSGNQVLVGAILLRGLFYATGAVSLFATALAMSCAMGAFLSAVAALTWAGLPSLLQSFVFNIFLMPAQPRMAFGPQNSLLAWPWLAQLAMNLGNLSPFQTSTFPTWPAPASLALDAWFVAWTILLLWLASGWWRRAPFERLGDAVFFPFLWNVYYAFLSFLSALVLTALLTQGRVYGAAWAATFFGLFAVGWFFWRFVIMWRGAHWARSNPHGPLDI